MKIRNGILAIIERKMISCDKFHLCIIFASLVWNFRRVIAQGCDGLETFERVNGLAPHSAPRLPLYSTTSGAVTAECSSRCRISQDCSAYLVHYDRTACFRFSTNPDSGSREDQLLAAPGRTSYFQKLCLRAPPCDKAWAFERVPGHEIAGHDDLVVQGVRTRTRCLELCLMERQLPCRSAEYWSGGNLCRISKQNRRTRPLEFRPAGNDVDYMENQCVDDPSPAACEFELIPDHEFAYVDLQLTARTQGECEHTCEETPSFRCRSFVWIAASSQCQLSGADASTIQGTALFRRPGAIFGQRALCLDAHLQCNRDTMLLRLRTKEPFVGRIFVQSRPECTVRGAGSTETEFRLPLNGGCGGLEEDPNSIYTNQVIVQHHPVIQRKGDKALRLVCRFDLANKTIASSLSFVVEAGRNEIPTSVVNASAPAPNIRLRILDRSGAEVVGARLGQPLLLRIDIDDEGIYGIFGTNLIARSGANTESVTLVDPTGCPTDPSVFPGFQVLPGSKSIEGPFEAFRFSDDAVVRFQLDVRFCLQQCKPARCDLGDSYGRRKRSTGNVNSLIRGTLGDTSDVYGITALQREIIVDNAVVAQESTQKGPTSVIFNTPGLSSAEESLVCATRSVVAISLIALALFHICVLAVCLICVHLRKRSKRQEMIIDGPNHPRSGNKMDMPPLWSMENPLRH